MSSADSNSKSHDKADLSNISRTRTTPRRLNDTPDIKLSKLLSKILRHKASEENIPIRQDGFVCIEDLLRNNKFQTYTFDDIQRVVAENNKKRFAIKNFDDHWYIRANQGHSIEVDVDLKPLLSLADFPEDVIHGTYQIAWESIKIDGLSRMKRKHIHFTSAIPGASEVISGIRSSATVYIYIDISKALTEGILFFQSTNEVILSPGNGNGIIPTYLFRKVVDRNGKHLLEYSR